MDMKKKNIILSIVLGTLLLVPTSCDDFLSETTDNRTEIDTEAKLESLLKSAYVDWNYSILAELSSDNVDDFGEDNPYTERFLDQVATWQNELDRDNDGPYFAWNGYWSAISTANAALAAIDELGGGQELDKYKAEALLCRAYSHFMLANLFCLPYSAGGDPANKLGLPYMTANETTLTPDHERGTLKELYDNIAADIEAALPLIDDSYLDVPKYHFNRNAAYAFASRFYLYYYRGGSEDEKALLNKSIEYANVVLGSNPADMLRDWSFFAELGSPDPDVYGNRYLNADENANLMLQTSISYAFAVWGGYGMGCRFNHGSALAEETVMSDGPWGSTYNLAYFTIGIYEATNVNKVVQFKYPELWEFLDPVAQTGYPRSVYPAFTTEDVLFNRAEAYALLGGAGNYAKAVEDLNAWAVSYLAAKSNNGYTRQTMTVQTITDFYNNLSYYTPEVPTVKKELHPDFTLLDQTQENIIHAILQARRITFLHEGMRWFDVKRWGIDVYRRVLARDASTVRSYEKLGYDDLRRALQLPSEVVSAGAEANPR